MARLRDYYLLAKPGIIYGNALHVLAGVFLAYQFDWSWTTALGVLFGTSLVIASACIVNNYFDREYDRKMERTKKRALAANTISSAQAISLAAGCLLLGMTVLILTTNLLTVVLGAVAYLSYVFIYTFSKRYTPHSTLIGTVPGALPGVAGYTAFSGSLDLTAWLIFAVLIIWQLPHFYAIAIRRQKQYQAAKFPLLTDVFDLAKMRSLMISLIILYTAVLTWLGLNTLYWPLTLVWAFAGIRWASLALKPLTAPGAWAKKVFVGSLMLSMLFCLVSLINFVVQKIM